MKKIIYITLIAFITSLFSSCDCDGDYIEDARNFEKDTALMYVWLNDQGGNLDYEYFAENGDYNYDAFSVEGLKHNNSAHRVWYVSNGVLYYRTGGETVCTVREINLGKYTVKNDTMIIKPYDSSSDSYEYYTPMIYTKVSKYP